MGCFDSDDQTESDPCGKVQRREPAAAADQRFDSVVGFLQPPGRPGMSVVVLREMPK